jgi:DNA polymerase-3 subunit epsilon
LREKIHDVSYELTGSELIALLIESEEIKKLKTESHHLHKKTYGCGIFQYETNGYTRLKIEKVNESTEPLMTFPNDKAAKSMLTHLIKEFFLCPKLCGNQTSTDSTCRGCLGACKGVEPAEAYNLRVKEAIKTFYYPYPNLLIIGKGRSFDEKSVVCIENGSYTGFGYLESSSTEENIFQIKEKILPASDNPDIRRIIRSYLNRHRRDRIIVY